MGGWYIGAAINLVGSIMINLGTNVMKLGHNKRAEWEARIGKKLAIRKFREWQIGVFLFIVGNVANFISFGYAAQSLLAALGSVQFISNVLFASLVLKEKVTKGVVLATLCIVTGCVTLVSFGSHESKQFTVEELMNLYRRPVYISYIFFMGITVVVTYGVYRIGKTKMNKVGLSGLGPFWNRLLPVSYALFSGLLGTQSVLFSKTLSTLLRVTFGGNSQLDSWFTWIIILTFLFTSTFWVTRLNKALKLFPALIIVPTMQISWTLFSILSGMLYFEEYTSFNALSGFMFALAVAVVFFGVYLLTKDQEDAPLPESVEKYANMISESEMSQSICKNDIFGGDGDDDDEGASIIDSDRPNGTLKQRIAPSDDPTNLDIGKAPLTSGYHPSDMGGFEPPPVPDLDSAHDSSGDRSGSPDLLSPMVSKNYSHGYHVDAHGFDATPKSPRNSAFQLRVAEAIPPTDPAGQSSSSNRPSLLKDFVEDFTIDIWSSFKETVGMGPEPTPAVSLFGPPVGIQTPRSSCDPRLPLTTEDQPTLNSPRNEGSTNPSSDLKPPEQP
ncbi:hypothetical protein BSKO_13287 [Bryopsis sp. KO-2023]|nr:hypothetical protein BSKO_13287 [Bryopsis sp. KO-2023]